MRKHRYVFAILILVFAILACAAPARESGPSLSGTIEVEGGTRVPQVDAVAAIQTFAQEVLGLSIPNLKAGGTTAEITLPITTQEGVDLAFDMAGTTYIGFWNQGIGALSVGNSTVSGDWAADVRDGSVGAFVVRQDQPVPGDAITALGQVISTYPGLENYDLVETPLENVEVQGYSFSARQVGDIGIQSWEVTLTGTTILAGVAPGVQDGRSVVWVVVASGALASPFNQ
jgi:hypothetical protein